jgi:hypothetical protein
MAKKDKRMSRSVKTNSAQDNTRKANQSNPSFKDNERDPHHISETDGDSVHMGATESQVIQTSPPTEALDKLLNEPSRPDDDSQTSNDQLTPG